MSINTNEVGSVVVQHILKEIPDALSKANYVWKLLADKQSHYVSGGTNIQFPIKLIANASQGFISGGSAAVNINQSQQLTYGALNWKFFYSNVSFSLEEFTKTQNAPEAIMDFIDAKKEMAKSDAVRALTEGIHNSSTTNALSFDGLKDITAASGTAYGGLLDTDYATGAYLPIIDTTTSSVSYDSIVKNLSKLRARAQQEGSPTEYTLDVGLWNASVEGAFLQAEQLKQRFYESKILETGFVGTKVNGVNFYLDNFVPGTQDGSTGDNYLYVLPSSVLKMAYKYGLKGKKSPMDGSVVIPNQPIESNKMYFAGNLICNNRRMILVFKNLVA